MTRVALSGAHQVGKTTLIGALGRDFQHVGGVMRKLLADGYSIGVDTTPRTIEAYLTEQLRSESGLDANRDIVSDRVMLDGLAYVETACEFGLASYSWSESEILLLRAAARAHASSYDVHCFIPIEFPAHSNLDFHRGGEEFREAVSRRMLANLSTEWPIPVEIVVGSIEQRVSTIHAISARLRGAL